MVKADPRKIFWGFIIAGLAVVLVTGVKPSLFYHEFGMWFLRVHTVIEFFTVAVSLVIGLYSFFVYRVNHSTRWLVLCMTFLASATLFVLHTLSFGGMPNTVIFPSANTGLYFWLTAQFVLILGFLLSVLIRKTAKSQLEVIPSVGVAFAVAVAIYLLVYHFSPQLPVLVTIFGLSPDKIIAEYVIIFLCALMVFLLSRQAQKQKQAPPYYLIAFFIFTIFAEFSFTLYPGVYYFHDLLGHIFRTIAYVFLLYAFLPQFRDAVAQSELKPDF